MEFVVHDGVQIVLSALFIVSLAVMARVIYNVDRRVGERVHRMTEEIQTALKDLGSQQTADRHEIFEQATRALHSALRNGESIFRTMVPHGANDHRPVDRKNAEQGRSTIPTAGFGVEHDDTEETQIVHRAIPPPPLEEEPSSGRWAVPPSERPPPSSSSW